MASEKPRYHENDTDPFSSPIHVLVNSDDGPREVDLDMRDRDVVFLHRADHTKLRLLHLQNVRDDTIAAARSAVDDFLNELKLEDDRKGYVYPWRPARTMSETWDEVHIGLCEYIEAKVEELGFRFEWEHRGFPRETLRNCFNQPTYKVRICEDGAEELTTGAHGVPLRCKRIPPEVQKGGNTQEA